MKKSMNKRVIRWILVAFCIVFLIAGLYFMNQKNELWMTGCFAIGLGCGVGVRFLNWSVYPEKYYMKDSSKEAVEYASPVTASDRNRSMIIWIAGIIIAVILAFLFFYDLPL